MTIQVAPGTSFRSIAAVARSVERVTAEQAQRMLVDAKAPKLWARPELCEQLAHALHLASAQVIWKAEAPPVSARGGPWARAQAAVNELRCVLPEILARLEQTDYLEVVPQEKRDNYKEVLSSKHKEAKVLMASLVDFSEPPARLSGPEWREHCISFWLYYRLIVGSGAATRNGPANRFVAAALRHAGYANTAKPEAIEAALTKWLKAGGKDQLSLMEASWSSGATDDG